LFSAEVTLTAKPFVDAPWATTHSELISANNPKARITAVQPFASPEAKGCRSQPFFRRRRIGWSSRSLIPPV
jgi:hypothetical protein